MVVLNRIYTRTGDDGTTSLGTGARRKKYDLRVEAYGTVDEVNAVIGLVRLHTAGNAPLDAALGRIQNDLFDVEADLCLAEKGPGGARLTVTDTQVEWLEGEIDRVGSQFRVRRGAGEMLIAADRAKRLCADWSDALAYLRSQANLGDADERLRLARWCHQHGLKEDALIELRTALDMRPTHPETQQLAKMLGRAAAPPSTPPPPPNPAPSRPSVGKLAGDECARGCRRGHASAWPSVSVRGIRCGRGAGAADLPVLPGRAGVHGTDHAGAGSAVEHAVGPGRRASGLPAGRRLLLQDRRPARHRPGDHGAHRR